MSERPVLLDLFCGAGGAAMGYHRAGFDVVGVDMRPMQGVYPFEFHQADAMTFPLDGFDAIHASPPCQAYSAGAAAAGSSSEHPDLYAPTRDRLIATGLPYIIENIIGAPYTHGFVLCGSMFGLRIRRHRNFEASWMVLMPFACDHSGERPVTITGKGSNFVGMRDYKHSRHAPVTDWPGLMGMPWAQGTDISLAIPPAYTEWIGRQLLAAMKVRATA